MRFVIIVLFVGLLGGAFPLFFNRDGSSLIIIGFGAGLLLLHNVIKEGNENIKGAGAVILLTIAATALGIASIAYNVLKYSTNFNKVLSVGFVILLTWEMFLVIASVKSKIKK